MKEIIFVVDESPEGGYEARALDHSIFTDGDDIEQLKANVKDAVATHFDAADMPKVIRLHMVKGDRDRGMRIPRDLTGKELINALSELGIRSDQAERKSHPVDHFPQRHASRDHSGSPTDQGRHAGEHSG
jgi:hypothetical protein